MIRSIEYVLMLFKFKDLEPGSRFVCDGYEVHTKTEGELVLKDGTKVNAFRHTLGRAVFVEPESVVEILGEARFPDSDVPGAIDSQGAFRFS